MIKCQVIACYHLPVNTCNVQRPTYICSMMSACIANPTHSLLDMFFLWLKIRSHNCSKSNTLNSPNHSPKENCILYPSKAPKHCGVQTFYKTGQVISFGYLQMFDSCCVRVVGWTNTNPIS